MRMGISIGMRMDMSVYARVGMSMDMSVGLSMDRIGHKYLCRCLCVCMQDRVRM